MRSWRRADRSRAGANGARRSREGPGEACATYRNDVRLMRYRPERGRQADTGRIRRNGMARLRHPRSQLACLLTGEERKWAADRQNDAIDPTETFAARNPDRTRRPKLPRPQIC
jgi:hypothetical protein